jgi:quercetin dioxygenase-like cupin family protein
MRRRVAMNVRKIAGLFLWLGLMLSTATVWVGRAQQPAPADDPRFTGKSETLEAKDLGVSRRRFVAGARSAWHSHDRGQLLFVEEGRARLQKRGAPVKELGRGESDYTGPNVAHWHGATPHEPFVQVAVGFGGETRWMEKVTDEEYQGKSVR